MLKQKFFVTFSVYVQWKKGRATRGEYKEVASLCRQKNRKSKAQLKLNLVTMVKDNKKCFKKYIGSKKRAKENLHPLLDTGERDY